MQLYYDMYCLLVFSKLRLEPQKLLPWAFNYGSQPRVELIKSSAPLGSGQCTAIYLDPIVYLVKGEK